MRGKRILFIVLAVVGVFLSGLSVTPCPAATQAPSEESNVSIQSVQLVVITSATSYDVYENEELMDLMEDQPAAPNHTYSDLDSIPKDRTIRIIYISDNSVLDALDSGTISELSGMASNGVFIGMPGDGAHLRDVLSITDKQNSGGVGDGSGHLYFTYAVPDGDRDDLLLSLENSPSNRNLLRLLIEWVYEIVQKHQIQAQSNGAWNASYSHQWKGSMRGGSYRFLVNVFKLNTDSTQYDWYLVDTSYQSAITDYQQNGGRCGWYTYSMDLEAVVDTSQGGSLYEYMPTGTVSNTTQGFSIGGTLTTSQAGLSAAYSHSYSTPDVVIADRSNYVTNTAKWDISFTGPNYTWYPWYSGPCNVSKHSYETQPALIVQVPKGKPMKVSFHPNIGHQNDSLTYYFLVLSVKKEKWYWTPSTLWIRVN